MFWDEPPEGLFEVDVGFEKLKNQHLVVFADINADKYTDVVTIDAESLQTLSIYLFNKHNLTFDFWRQI
jgi:hypothetical protein